MSTVTTVAEQAQAILSATKTEGTKEKFGVMVNLTKEQNEQLKAIALNNNTSVANLLRVALKVTYGIE